MGSWLGIDKVQHFAVYAAVGFAISFVLAVASPVGTFSRRWRMAAALVMLAGVADEYRQYFDPRREADVLDAAANFAGIVIGSLPAHLFRRMRRLPERGRAAAGGARGGLSERMGKVSRLPGASANDALPPRSRVIRSRACRVPPLWPVAVLWFGLAFITENKAEHRALRALVANLLAFGFGS